MTRRTPPETAGHADREPPDFEACMQQLEQIVQELESGQVPLARAMSLFEEGQRLGKTCRALLDAAQVQVDRLLERADGSVETQPFEP
jgi:exodeoxyribonuclease VII small subunit